MREISNPILLLHAGGTICSGPMGSNKGVGPCDDIQYFSRYGAEIVAHKISNELSENLQYSDLKAMADAIETRGHRHVVVLHGTDTAARTLAYLDMTCPTRVILMVCSQKSPDKPDSQARKILDAAISAVCEIKDNGAYVIGYWKPARYLVHHAKYAFKRSSYDKCTFVSQMATCVPGRPPRYMEIQSGRLFGNRHVICESYRHRAGLVDRRGFVHAKCGKKMVLPRSPKFATVPVLHSDSSMMSNQRIAAGYFSIVQAADSVVMIGTGLSHIPRDIARLFGAFAGKIHIGSRCPLGPKTHKVYSSGRHLRKLGFQIAPAISVEYYRLFLELGGRWDD